MEEYIFKSPFANHFLESESTKDIYENLERSFSSDKTAFHDVFTDESLTFKQVHEVVNRIAQNLYHQFGFRAGEHFAFCSPNNIEYLLVSLAVWKLGGVHVGINLLLKPDEIRRELELVDCKLLYAHPFTAANAVKAVEGTNVKAVFVKGDSPGCTPYSRLEETPEAPVEPLPSASASPGDVGAILFSSGTTGLPKAVEITHRGFNNCLYTAGDPGYQTACSHRVVYQPFSHVYGIGLAFVAIRNGETCHILSRFDLNAYLKCTAEYRVNNLMLVPPIAVLLVKTPLDPDLDLSCVTDVYSGAAPMYQETAEAVKQKLGGKIYFRQLYGLTETIGLAVGTPGQDTPYGGDNVPAGSIGMLAPGLEGKIRSIEDGKTLGVGERGELCVRGGCLMKGYAHNPEATRDCMDDQGWFRTGDICYVDEKGYVFVVDRLKELIKYHAYQVAPAELENTLLCHEAIADAGVIGIPDPEAGELPFAWVVLKPNCTLTEKELQDWVAERVAAFKKLRGGVKFVPQIPKSGSGKILRREIRAATLAEMKK